MTRKINLYCWQSRAAGRWRWFVDEMADEAIEDMPYASVITLAGRRATITVYSLSPLSRDGAIAIASCWLDDTLVQVNLNEVTK